MVENRKSHFKLLYIAVWSLSLHLTAHGNGLRIVEDPRGGRGPSRLACEEGKLHDST